MATPKIAIIGAGPAGCTLARLLHLSSIPCTIYESESAPSSRSQGGTLDLHTDTGLAAIKACGLNEEYLKLARFDGEAFHLCDKNLTTWVKLGGTRNEKSSRGRPEIDRSQLRRILFDSLPEGIIKWGHKVHHISRIDRTVHFMEASLPSSEPYDLIVGADGAWSKVRSLLTDVKPIYSGVSGLELHISNAAKTYPELNALVNRGSLFAYSDGKHIGAQQKSDGSLIIYLSSVRPEDWIKRPGYDVHDPVATKQSALQEFADWHPELRRFVEVADESEGSLITRNHYQLPTGTKWTHKAGFTLIGDAAHLMTPYAGEGVNVAMRDAMDLASAIVFTVTELRENMSDLRLLERLSRRVEEFENVMFRRGAKWQAITQQNVDDAFFNPRFPAKRIESFVARAICGSDANIFTTIFVYIMSYAYFTLYKVWLLILDWLNDRSGGLDDLRACTS
ncbi:MAG: hypothetical protein MMC33_008674 [Icmadophila ericetorum]|nr:hypothetical protein [Icmadophila ericetorum]